MNIKPIVIFSSALVLAACGGGSGDDDSAEGKGALSVRLTDAPVDDAAHVYVSIAGISLKRIDDDEDEDDELEDSDDDDMSDDDTDEDDEDEDEEESAWVSYPVDSTPPQVDLLTLQSGATFGLLEGEELTAGSYKIRLNLNFDEYTEDERIANPELVNPPNSIIIEEGGQEFELKVPSGQQTGLKLNEPIEIDADGNANYTIDFDVRKSIVERGNGSNRYLLKPVLRLVKDDETGNITGIVYPTDHCQWMLALRIYQSIWDSDVNAGPSGLCSDALRETSQCCIRFRRQCYRSIVSGWTSLCRRYRGRGGWPATGDLG